MERRGSGSRVQARDAGLTRLRRATRVTIFGATALAGAFAALAAHSAPGHQAAARATPTRHAVKRMRPATSTLAATRAASDDQQQAPSQPATPAVAPALTKVAPVAVTGGS